MNIPPAQSPRPVLAVENLTVGFGRGRARREVVHGISFDVGAGECLAIVGESGSGKSVTARTLVGLTGDDSYVSADRLQLGDVDLRGLGDRRWRRIRGAEVGFVLQDALSSLDPLRPVGSEIAETLRVHRRGTAARRRARVIDLLRAVGVPEPEMRARQLPHQLSGGLRQRALIASAIALDPYVIIADEPTTALDVTVASQVLDVLATATRRGTALILISHDLAVVSRLAGRVAVIKDGAVVEHGPIAQVLGSPEHPYTRTLIDAVPSRRHRRARLLRTSPAVALPGDAGETPPAPAGTPLISARSLVKRYEGPDGVTRTVVDDVSFELRAGETLGVVGESGAGKSTVVRMVLALSRPDSGEVLLDGRPWSAAPEKDRRPRRRLITCVHQDSLSYFDPRWTVRKILADALPRRQFPDRRTRHGRILELLRLVGLGEEHVDRRPLTLSGGQRQRVGIALALAPRPSVIICDEPVSALDLSIQAQVLDLFTDLQEKLGVAYLFVSHDLGVIHHVSDRVVVMKDGRIVEHGATETVFREPRHPYTQQLLSALPALPLPEQADIMATQSSAGR